MPLDILFWWVNKDAVVRTRWTSVKCWNMETRIAVTAEAVPPGQPKIVSETADNCFLDVCLIRGDARYKFTNAKIKNV
jgi:hypothetical protein